MSKTKSPEQVAFPDALAPDIQDEPEWRGFVQMRKKLGKPLTDRARQMALTRLEMLAPGDLQRQRQILDQSTYCCWLGLYPLRGEAGATGSSYDLAELEKMIDRDWTKEDVGTI